MSDPRFTRILAAGALATTLAGGLITSTQAMPLPVTSVQEIAGAAPTEQVRWYGYRWGGYGWGWRRPNYGGAIAAGAIAGGLLGLATAATVSSYYPYSYGYGYPSYGYSYGYPSYGYSYYPAYYSYPAYYGSYGASYGWGYRGGYWLSGGRGHKHKRHAR